MKPYLIPTALGVHKYQQGLHERSWHGLDDKRFPPPFLQETPQVLQQMQGNANSYLQLSPNITHSQEWVEHNVPATPQAS